LRPSDTIWRVGGDRKYASAALCHALHSLQLLLGVRVGFPTSQDFAVVIFFDNGWA